MNIPSNVSYVKVVVPSINSQIEKDIATPYEAYKQSDTAITATMRSVVDTGILYQDELKNVDGKWVIDRIVNAGTGLKQAIVCEDAIVDGMPIVYKNGSTMVLNPTIMPVVNMQVIESDGEFNLFTPTLTFTTSTPTGITSSFKYSKKGKKVTVMGDFVATNGLGATNLTITLPFTVKTDSSFTPVDMQVKTGATWSSGIAYLDSATSLIKFRTFNTFTTGQACEIHFNLTCEVI